MRQLEKVNKELLLVFSMFVIAFLLNFLIDAQRMVLYVYTLPTVASAYIYGRRHATLTAFASVLLVTLLTMTSGVFGKEALGDAGGDDCWTWWPGAAASSSPPISWARSTNTRTHSSRSCAQPITACS